MHVGTLVTRSDIVFAVEMGWPAQLTEAVWLAGQELVLCAEEACDSVGLLSRHGVTVPCNPHDYVTLKAQLPALLEESPKERQLVSNFFNVRPKQPLAAPMVLA